MTDNTDTITDTPTPSTRGGYRAGAGRPAGAKDKTPRTRARIGTFSLQLRISDELKDALQARAEERGVAPSAIARDILEQALLGEED